MATRILTQEITQCCECPDYDCGYCEKMDKNVRQHNNNRDEPSYSAKGSIPNWCPLPRKED